MFVKDEDGDEIQITSGGQLNEDAPYVMQTPDESPSYPLSYDSIYTYQAEYSGTNQALRAYVNGYLRVKNGSGVTKIEMLLQCSTYNATIGSEMLVISGSVPVPAGYIPSFTQNAASNCSLSTEREYSTEIKN
jgi:hypothetical protein